MAIKLDNDIRKILIRIYQKHQDFKISDIKKLYKDLSFNISLLQIRQITKPKANNQDYPNTRQITKPKANNPDYHNAVTYKKDLSIADNHIQKAIDILEKLNFDENKNNTNITLRIQRDLNYSYQIDVLKQVKESIKSNLIKSKKYNKQHQINNFKKEILDKMLEIFVENNLQNLITTTQQKNNDNEYPIFFALYKTLCQINDLFINEEGCKIFKQKVSSFKKGL